VNSGLGPFYDGIAHLLVTPEEVLVVIAMALLAGLGGNKYGRYVLFLFPLAWLAGALAGWTLSVRLGMPLLSAAWLIALGALVASDWRLPLPLAIGFAIAVGFAHGFVMTGAAPASKEAGLAVAGSVCAVFVIVALVAGQVSSIRRSWARITVRVAGSWIGAIGLLLLGWASR
jgi:hydrogenase/urease accessory protein HupE